MTEPKLLQDLLAREWNEGLSWRGFVQYSTRNVERMKENYEKTEINPSHADEIKAIRQEIRILALGADWCGDAITNLPAIVRLTELNPKIEFRVLDRDRHQSLMNEFLTNGAKSIPKVVIAPADFSRHAVWGARPAECQAIMTANKDKMPKEEIIPMIRAWYEQDKHRSLLSEVLAAIKSVATQG